MTIKECLHKTKETLIKAGIEAPALEAGVILCHVLSCGRTYLYTHEDRELDPSEMESVRLILEKRAEKVPLQYILGRTEFMSLEFLISPAVLIPRQDTEILVEKCIELVKGLSSMKAARTNGIISTDMSIGTDMDRAGGPEPLDMNIGPDSGKSAGSVTEDMNMGPDMGKTAGSRIEDMSVGPDVDKAAGAGASYMSKGHEDRKADKIRVLDMCTGSGCIGISIAHYCPECRVTACDISQKALETARANSELAGVQSRLELRRGDLFEVLDGEERYDIIASNPPYIETAEICSLQREVRDYEPATALDGGADGLDFYRRITAAAPQYLNESGYLVFEIGYNQGESVSRLMESSFEGITILKDLGGNDRVVVGRKQDSVVRIQDSE